MVSEATPWDNYDNNGQIYSNKRLSEIVCVVSSHIKDNDDNKGQLLLRSTCLLVNLFTCQLVHL